MNTNYFRFKELDYVEIIKRNHGHAFEIGETVMISIAEEGNSKDCCDVHSYGWQNNPSYSVFNREGHCMNVGDCELKLSTKEKFDKKIHFRHFSNRSKLKGFLAKKPELLQHWNIK